MSNINERRQGPVWVCATRDGSPRSRPTHRNEVPGIPREEPAGHRDSSRTSVRGREEVQSTILRRSIPPVRFRRRRRAVQRSSSVLHPFFERIEADRHRQRLIVGRKLERRRGLRWSHSQQRQKTNYVASQPATARIPPYPCLDSTALTRSQILFDPSSHSAHGSVRPSRRILAPLTARSRRDPRILIPSRRSVERARRASPRSGRRTRR